MVRSRLVGMLIPAFFLLARSSAQETQLKFAWLSDTHVGSTTGADDLRASVRDINMMKDVRFVLISGDVTEMGSNEQLSLARAILDSLRIPFHIIPGNHDTKWSESGATEFFRLWGNDRFVFTDGGFCFIGLHQGPRMRMGDGHWAPEDLRWLDSLLATAVSKNQRLVFVTHYPIDPGIDNWYEFIDRVKKFNTQLVLVGHGHANRIENFEGIPGVMGRSNLRGRDSVGGYNLVSFHGDTASFIERMPGVETQRPWYALVLRRIDYGSDTTHYPRPDYSVNSRFPGVRSLWEHSTGYTICATPAHSDDAVIVGDASGTVYALRLSDGSVAWRFITGGPVYSSPAATAGRVVFGSADGTIYCLQAASGAELWRVRTGAPVVACPIVDHGVVYVGGSDRVFRALDLRSGSVIWKFTGLTGFVETRPLLYLDRVVFGAWDEHLYALNIADGTLSWSWKGDRPGVLYSPAACWPVAAHGRVTIVAPDRMMTMIDARSGAQVWRSGAHQVRESIGISEDGERVYVRTMQDSILCLRTREAVPTPLWSSDLHFGYDINSAMLVEKNGTLFFGTKNGLIMALDAETGRVVWEHREGPGLVNTLLPLSANRVVLTDSDGRVMLLEGGGRGE